MGRWAAVSSLVRLRGGHCGHSLWQCTQSGWGSPLPPYLPLRLQSLNAHWQCFYTLPRSSYTRQKRLWRHFPDYSAAPVKLDRWLSVQTGGDALWCWFDYENVCLVIGQTFFSTACTFSSATNDLMFAITWSMHISTEWNHCTTTTWMHFLFYCH